MKWTRSLLVVLLISIFAGPFSVHAVHAEESVINQMVVLPTNNYDVKEAQAMIGRLQRIPTPILSTLNTKGVKIILTNDIITNVPELNNLKGVIPRGWESTGLTWDDVPGVSEQDVVV